MDNPHLRFDWSFLVRHIPDLLSGAGVTLEIFFLAVFIASIFGIFLAFGRLRRKGFFYGISTAYIEFYRNTPLLLQLFFVFFALPLIGIRFSPFATAVIALAAQHSAFFAEIYRGAIQSITKTQHDAARALGMRDGQVMWYIILPQAIRDAIPTMGNNLVLLLLDVSLAYTVGVIEITMNGYILAERSAASLEIFMGVAIIYLLLSGSLSGILRLNERRYRVVR